MAVPELFTGEDGRVPAFQNREIGGKTWVTIGGDLDKLPSYITGRPIPSEDSVAPGGDKAFRGRLRPMKDVHFPDWYEPPFHWRAFWPTDPTKSGRLRKLFLDGSDVPIDPAYSLNTITPRLDVKDIYKDLYSRINRIVEDAGGKIIPNMPRDLWPSRNPWDLDRPFESVAAMQKAASDVKLLLLEGIAWVRWLHAVLPRIHKHRLFLSTEEDYLEICLLDLPSRGVVCNLAKDWREINIGFWLSSNVPVYYPWRLEERVQARFAKLSPILLSIYSSEEHVALDDIDPKGNYEEVARQSTEYDDFFQLKDPGYESLYETFEMGPSTEFYVVDFEGWGRRALLASLEISAYRNALHFQIESDGFDNSVTFWRWRPRDRALALQLPSHFDNFHDGNPTRSGGARSFLVPGKSLSNGVRIDPREYTHWTRASGGEPTTEDTMDVSSEEDGSTPLLFRLASSGKSSLATPPLERRSAPTPSAPVRRGKSLDLTRRGPMSRSPPVRDRSASPTRSVESLALTPIRRYSSTVQLLLREEVRPLTYPYSILHLTEQGAWNFLLMDVGVLILPDEKAEVRLRYFGNCVQDFRHVSNLLRLGIERRLHFSIGVPGNRLDWFAPRDLSPGTRTKLAALYSSSTIETPLKYESSTKFIAGYRARVTEVLSRPHARAFIGLGGAASWLAQYWGGKDLIVDFMQGPSVQTTIFRRGDNDLAHPASAGLYWDSVSAQEIDILFGHIPHADSNHERWLYPPEFVLEKDCDHYTGEWNETMDKIFEYLTKKISATSPKIEPKSRGKWKEWLQTYNRGKWAVERPKPADHDFEEVLGKLKRVGLQRSWDHLPLAKLYLPEQAE
ncbi:hypothetical protein CVT26_002412 [Gymnopilus dilepis]|uniref:Uncharacterized protein n=1 Tax=Gymnopilus dilepis TaxID=231916 RepID=A0A409Y3B5_9AGAR|nr:hypothetical protein CVT26_002412 [Gymnopilus dilepis]